MWYHTGIFCARVVTHQCVSALTAWWPYRYLRYQHLSGKRWGMVVLLVPTCQRQAAFSCHQLSQFSSPFDHGPQRMSCKVATFARAADRGWQHYNNIGTESRYSSTGYTRKIFALLQCFTSMALWLDRSSSARVYRYYSSTLCSVYTVPGTRVYTRVHSVRYCNILTIYKYCNSRYGSYGHTHNHGQPWTTSFRHHAWRKGACHQHDNCQTPGHVPCQHGVRMAESGVAYFWSNKSYRLMYYPLLFGYKQWRHLSL